MSTSRSFPGWALLTLHILPGILLLLGFVTVAPFFWRIGVPVQLAVMVVICIMVLPFEWAILLWQGRLRTGRWTIKGALDYTLSIPIGQHIVLTILLVAWSIISAGLLTYLFEGALHTSFLNHLPAWMDLSRRADTSAIPEWVLFAAYLLIIGMAAPLTEELYFRGFLLPRLGGPGGWAILVHSALFSLGHFLEPYAFVSRFVAILPVVWLVRRKKNISIAVTYHILLNVFSAMVMLSGMFER